jgi:hypothetical protein
MARWPGAVGGRSQHLPLKGIRDDETARVFTASLCEDELLRGHPKVSNR